MSAEGKKKRGESGRANALSQPFRLSGGGVWPSHFRRVMDSLPGYAERIGRPREGSAWDRKGAA
jgi:hypothetical protein